jgi:UDP-glucose 4-epimerase
MTNAWGTFRMAEVARKVGAKFIHVSTGSVMNGKPISYYGVSKLAGESYLRAVAEYYSHFNFSVVRVYHVYGPRQDDSDKGGVVPIFIRQAYNQQPLTIHGDGMQVRHFTYVQDVVNALIYVACGNYHAKYFDFFNRDKTTIFNLARKVSRLMNADTFCFKFSDPRPGDIKNFDQKPTLDSASGFMDLEFGLKKTIDWYLEQYEWKRGNISMCSY